MRSRSLKNMERLYPALQLYLMQNSCKLSLDISCAIAKLLRGWT